MEKHKINFTKLVESLRWYEKEYKGSIMDEEDKKTFSLAADVLEDLLQSVAEWTARYEAERDKNRDAVPVVRCGECANETCSKIHKDMPNWFCAGGERKDGEHEIPQNR